VTEEKQSNPWAYDFDADHAHVMNQGGADNQPKSDDTTGDDQTQSFDEQDENGSNQDNAGQDDSNVSEVDEGVSGE